MDGWAGVSSAYAVVVGLVAIPSLFCAAMRASSFSNRASSSALGTSFGANDRSPSSTGIGSSIGAETVMGGFVFEFTAALALGAGAVTGPSCSHTTPRQVQLEHGNMRLQRSFRCLHSLQEMGRCLGCRPMLPNECLSLPQRKRFRAQGFFCAEKRICLSERWVCWNEHPWDPESPRAGPRRHRQLSGRPTGLGGDRTWRMSCSAWFPKVFCSHGATLNGAAWNNQGKNIAMVEKASAGPSKRERPRAVPRYST